VKERTARSVAEIGEAGRVKARGEAAGPRPMNAEDRVCAEEEGLFLCFRVAEERYLLDVRAVKEVTRVQRLTPVPRSPEGIVGVIDLRGTFIPVVDVRQRLGGGGTIVDPRCSRIVVVVVGGRVAGLLVDALQPVVRFPVSQIQPPPSLALSKGSDFIAGLCSRAGDAYLVIAPERLLALSAERPVAESAA
jgi:purine-binding chemotaxis protein CheW